jgi:hypothetical protein
VKPGVKCSKRNSNRNVVMTEDDMDWSVVWTAVGGIAQAAAAIATFLAVGVALWLGIREGRRSLQARYDDARPVLIIGPDPSPHDPWTHIPVHQGNDHELDWSKQPYVNVSNVGNGPAFNVKSVIYGPEAIAVSDSSTTLGVFENLSGGVTWKHFSTEKENHWYHWTTDAISQGNRETLQYTLAGPNTPYRFSEANKQIESKDHKQTYTFNAPKHPLSKPTLKEPWSICRMTITYHDIFHRKHASIYDLIFCQGWQQKAIIDDITNDLSDLVG